MEADKKVARDHARAVLIASFLGEGWTYDLNESIDDEGRAYPNAVIAGPAGMVLRISGEKTFPQAQRGKIRIAADLGVHERPRGVDDLTIFVSASREPEAIAGDIQRRLLPKYEPALRAAHARFAESESHRGKLAAQVAQFKALGGTTVPHREHTVYFDLGDDASAVEIECHGDTAAVKIGYLPSKQAHAMVAFLLSEGRMNEALAALDALPENDHG